MLPNKLEVKICQDCLMRPLLLTGDFDVNNFSQKTHDAIQINFVKFLSVEP